MKNTALVLTSATIATLFVMIGIAIADYMALWEFYMIFYSNYWVPGVFGWICIVVACAATVMAFVLASREMTTISYVLGAIAGAFLAIVMNMLLFAGLD